VERSVEECMLNIILKLFSVSGRQYSSDVLFRTSVAGGAKLTKIN
jgi:hypothetical protein